MQARLPSLAVQQAQAQQLTAAQLIPEFEQNITIQENALRVLTGALPASIALNTTLDGITLPDNLSAGIPIKYGKPQARCKKC